MSYISANTESATLWTNKKPPIAVDGVNKFITHIIPHEEETKMKYRVRLNEVLYFARFEEIEIVAIADHAPGYIDGAALFDSKKSAQHVADVTCGTVVEVEE